MKNKIKLMGIIAHNSTAHLVLLLKPHKTIKTALDNPILAIAAEY